MSIFFIFWVDSWIVSVVNKELVFKNIQIALTSCYLVSCRVSPPISPEFVRLC